MVSMVLVPYGINPNFDIVPRISMHLATKYVFLLIKIKLKTFGLVLCSKFTLTKLVGIVAVDVFVGDVFVKLSSIINNISFQCQFDYF
ncbi:hypothetical protein BpHYR1_010748 [Brachionus plicatilis]|uniref:Uncharacterized protein n=1 Tax=Brachionus plicatilis TaxID=10195 RepID=A0A3M7RWL2_BRAPC|nr:hypothetical protein BpHYR1_010748 [Brachionus plicatilis]